MGRPAISTLLRLFAVSLTPAWLAGCSPTATYGTGEAPEMALFREMTGGLLSTDKKPPIQYQQRAPLVVPPSAEELPPPVTAAAASPDWPTDPSEGVAVARKDDLRYGAGKAEYRRLKPIAGVLPQTPRNERTSTGSPYDIVHSKRQQEQFRKAIADANGYGRRERRSLTEPPNEYREPASTAPTEFEDIRSGGGGGFMKWFYRR